MRKPIHHPLFDGMNVELETNPWGLQVKHSILEDGKKANEIEKNVYSLQNQSGEAVRIEIKKNISLKIFPELSINGDSVKMSRPLRWYEYIFIFLPVSLVLLAGAIGGALGTLSAYMNYLTFQNENLSIGTKLLIGFGINTAAFAICFILIMFVAF